jgi:hypothetical protein
MDRSEAVVLGPHLPICDEIFVMPLQIEEIGR